MNLSFLLLLRVFQTNTILDFCDLRISQPLTLIRAQYSISPLSAEYCLYLLSENLSEVAGVCKLVLFCKKDSKYFRYMGDMFSVTATWLCSGSSHRQHKNGGVSVCLSLKLYFQWLMVAMVF